MESNYLNTSNTESECLYIELCKIAVTNNGLALQYVDTHYMTQGYGLPASNELCKIAVTNNGLALQYVDTSCVDNIDHVASDICYKDLCLIAVKNTIEAHTYCSIQISNEDLIRANILMSRVLNISIPDNLVKELTRDNEICCVCYDNTPMITSCNHYVCNYCLEHLTTIKCPICRKT